MKTKFGRTDPGTIFGWIIGAGLILAIAYWLVSSHISEKRTEAEKQEAKAREQKAESEKELERERRIKKSIDTLVTKHNAVTDWDKALPDYTIEVQDAFVRTDGRPALIIAPVMDIIRNSQNHTIYCSVPDWFAMMYQKEFFAVVARISSVRKIRFELHVDAPGPENYTGSEDVHIELGAASPNFLIAKGICLDILPVGGYFSFGNHFSYGSDLLLTTRVCFVLDCTQEQVETIMSQRGNKDKERHKEFGP